jgi:UDP-glucose 4-epimerase
MSTILVTGGAGYVGSHVVLALRDAGYAVAVVDDLSSGLRRAVPADVAFYRGDVADRTLFDRIAGEREVLAILHFAGSTVVSESMSDPLKYYRNNVVASQRLIEHALRHRVGHFVFSSTAAVYGMPKQGYVSEDAPLLPINPYGASKAMTERMLADVACAYPLNYAILRYFNVAGADPAGRAGQSTKLATHLVKVAAQAALGMRPGVSIFGDDYETPDGTGVRDYIHVSDLAAVHVAALERLLARPGESLTMNCGYGRGFSVLEVLDAVDDVAGLKLARTLMPRRGGDAGLLVADTGRVRSTLDWTPRFDNLTTIITHALAWERRLQRVPATP